MPDSANQRSSAPPRSWEEAEQLNDWRYSRVRWGEIMDLQHFVTRCPWRECSVEKMKGRRCPFRCRGCITGTTPLRVRAAYRETEAAREKAAEEARALEDRAEEENPGLYRQDKIWLPHAPGVAIIRGNLLVDVASFFRDCDITVREHNAPNTNHFLQGKGRDIVEMYEDTEIRRVFMRWHAQVRVQIDRFRSPPDTIDLEHPGERVLCGLRGQHGNAMCGLIVFLGSTGGPEAGKVDRKCSYWFHSPLGFPGKNLWDIGDTPFRMVRIPTKPDPDVYELMLRFDLARGKTSAKHFDDNSSKNVKDWKVLHNPFEDFHWGSLQNVSPEPIEDDEPNAPEPADPAEGSEVTNQSDMSGSEDLDGIPMRPRERAACKMRFDEAQAQASRERELAETRASRSREIAEDQADSERGFAELRAADTERLTKAIAERERRHAVQAARQREELAEAQAARERRLAETQADHERNHLEAAEGNEGSQTESGGTMAPEEEEVSKNEPRRYITRSAPESLRRGGKI